MAGSVTVPLFYVLEDISSGSIWNSWGPGVSRVLASWPFPRLRKLVVLGHGVNVGETFDDRVDWNVRHSWPTLDVAHLGGSSFV